MRLQDLRLRDPWLQTLRSLSNIQSNILNLMPDTCTHLDQIAQVGPATQGCQECLETGDTWVHLRLCLICGHVGCCDSSKNKHATRHFKETGHPVMRSFEPGENWGWCYIDEVFFEFEEEE